MKWFIVSIVAVVMLSGCSKKIDIVRYSCPIKTDVNPEITHAIIHQIRAESNRYTLRSCGYALYDCHEM